MAAAAGMAERFRRACWFFSHAAWDADELGLAVARLIVKYLLAGGEPVIVAVDGTFFRRWGKKVAQARWAYDGSAQGGKKVAFGNTWVVAVIVVQLPFCSSPVALPVLFRLWRTEHGWGHRLPNSWATWRHKSEPVSGIGMPKLWAYTSSRGTAVAITS